MHRYTSNGPLTARKTAKLPAQAASFGAPTENHPATQEGLFLFSAKVSPVEVGWRAEAQEGDGEGEVVGVGRRAAWPRKRPPQQGVHTGPRWSGGARRMEGI